MGQHRHQFLGHVPAAKDIHPSGGVDLLHKNVPDSLRMPGVAQVAGVLNAPEAQSLGIQAHGALLSHVRQQPQIAAGLKFFLRLFAESEGVFIPCGEIVEKHIAGAAADHAQVLHIVPGQGKIVAPGAFCLQHLPGDFFRAVLHRAAADGAADTAVLSHQHPGTRAPGSGPGGSGDGDQHQILSAPQAGSNGFQHITHGFLPPAHKIRRCSKVRESSRHSQVSARFR